MGFIDYEVEGAVGIITINRPKALNALNEEVLNDLEKTFDAGEAFWVQPDPGASSPVIMFQNPFYVAQ